MNQQSVKAEKNQNMVVPSKPSLIDLPEDLLLCIMELCDPHDLAMLGETCTLLHTFSQYDFLWKRFCEKAINVKDPDLGEVNSYRELYTTLLHRYGGMIGLYQVIAGPFGGLTEVRYSRGTLEGITWDPEFVDSPLKANVCFSLRGGNKYAQCLCLPFMAPHSSIITLEKDSGRFSHLCFSPKDHAKAVWKDFQYQHDFDFIHREELFRRFKSKIFKLMQSHSHEKKLLCLSHCYDFRLVHKPLVLPHANDIPESLLMPDGSCPKQLIAPGLFTGNGIFLGTQLFVFKYRNEKELCAFKVTGDDSVPAEELYFTAMLEYPVSPISVNDQKFHFYEELLDLEMKKGRISDISEQSFRLPLGTPLSVSYDKCYARYHGKGVINCVESWYECSLHVIVFDPDTVCVLWLDCEHPSLYKRILQGPRLSKY
ncbi:F-box only protein 31-like isoform X2 [Penaeus indicus]